MNLLFDTTNFYNTISQWYSNPPDLNEAQAWMKNNTRDFMATGSLYATRIEIIKPFSFAIPSIQTLNTIKELATAPLVEVGAGTGIWSKLLNDNGVDIIATDKGEDKSDYQQPVGHHYPIHSGMLIDDVIKRWSDRDVLMIWPCYDKDWSAGVKMMKSSRRLFLIGEGEGGCTGSSKLFNVLDKKFNHISDHNIVQWPYIHDYLSIWERK